MAAKKAVDAMIASRMIRLVNRFSGYKAVRASINGGVQLATTPSGYNSDSTNFSISKRPNQWLRTARACETPSHRTNISSFLEFASTPILPKVPSILAPSRFANRTLFPTSA